MFVFIGPQARGKGDMVLKFQKFIALFFFVWWSIGAGELRMRVLDYFRLWTPRRVAW